MRRAMEQHATEIGMVALGGSVTMVHGSMVVGGVAVMIGKMAPFGPVKGPKDKRQHQRPQKQCAPGDFVCLVCLACVTHTRHQSCPHLDRIPITSVTNEVMIYTSLMTPQPSSPINHQRIMIRILKRVSAEVGDTSFLRRGLQTVGPTLTGTNAAAVSCSLPRP